MLRLESAMIETSATCSTCSMNVYLAVYLYIFSLLCNTSLALRNSKLAIQPRQRDTDMPAEFADV